MESQTKKDISLRVLVEETLGRSEDQRFEPVTYQSLKTYQINQVKPGFYTIKNGDMLLDFPKNWGAFNEVNENNVVDLSDFDNDLNMALSTFFDVSGDFKLVKSSDSIYFVFSPYIKKAAA
jgi:hypothetical protein